VRHRRRYLGPIGTITISISLLLAGCGAGGPPTPGIDTAAPPAGGGDSSPSEGETELAALVNGQPVTVAAYEAELQRFEAGRAALGLTAAEGGYQQQVLDLLIEQELIRQEAAAQGISVSDVQVDAAINEMIAESGEEYFNGWLAGNFYSLEEFRELIRMDILSTQLLTPVIEAVPTRAEQVHARHILVNSQEVADDVLARLQAGEDFAALAAEYSVDVTTRDTGGDLGWFPRGGLLVPEVEEIAFSQQPGQISDVLMTAWGYHIVQTLEFDPDREIEAETRQRLLEQAKEEWRRRLRADADIQQLVTFTQ
jgi:parvulin-like peptidyl-prolyl isomerase